MRRAATESSMSRTQAVAQGVRLRHLFLLNVALAGLSGKEGDLMEACDQAEAELVRLLLDAGNGKA